MTGRLELIYWDSSDTLGSRCVNSSTSALFRAVRGWGGNGGGGGQRNKVFDHQLIRSACPAPCHTGYFKSPMWPWWCCNTQTNDIFAVPWGKKEGFDTLYFFQVCVRKWIIKTHTDTLWLNVGGYLLLDPFWEVCKQTEGGVLLSQVNRPLITPAPCIRPRDQIKRIWNTQDAYTKGWVGLGGARHAESGCLRTPQILRTYCTWTRRCHIPGLNKGFNT